MPCDSVGAYNDVGVPIRRMWLRETWGAWVPLYRTIIIAEGLSDIHERCTIAHHMEHALANDGPCTTGPHADRLRKACLLSQRTLRQDAAADHAAARRLLDGVQLRPVASASELCTAAGNAGVTERLLAIRLTELFGERAWLATSKIVG